MTGPQFYFLIPFSAMISDLAVVLFVGGLRIKRPYTLPLLIFYSLVAIWNGVIMTFFVTDSEVIATWASFFFHNWAWAIAVSFLAFCLSVYTSKKLRDILVFRIALGLGLLQFVVVQISFWLPETFGPMVEMHRYEWGFYPIGKIGAKFIDLVFAWCIPLGLYFLYKAAFRPSQMNGNNSRNLKLPSSLHLKPVFVLFVILWLGLVSNFLPVHGIDVYPIGNGVDAVIAAIIASLLYRHEQLKPSLQIRLRFAGILTAISASLIVYWIFLEFILPDEPVSSAIAGVVISITALTVFLMIFSPKMKIQDSRPLFARLQADYNLTYQEAIICNLLHEGHAREEVLHKMQIAKSTMKVHMTSIYRKTIEKSNVDPSNRKDKLQRLTVFLQNMG